MPTHHYHNIFNLLNIEYSLSSAHNCMVFSRKDREIGHSNYKSITP